jgi:hypothetical protein
MYRKIVIQWLRTSTNFLRKTKAQRFYHTQTYIVRNVDCSSSNRRKRTYGMNSHLYGERGKASGNE